LRWCQCARVSATEARLWVRLVGRRHDIQLWQPDSRGLDTLSCTRSLKSLRSSEHWLQSVLKFVQQRHAPPKPYVSPRPPMNTDANAHTHASTHTYSHTHVHTRARALTLSHTHTHTRARACAHTHTCSNSHVKANTYMYAHQERKFDREVLGNNQNPYTSHLNMGCQSP
jgi:hypothetical protein